jgi:hypothetical protein
LDRVPTITRPLGAEGESISHVRSAVGIARNHIDLGPAVDELIAIKS